MAALSIRDRLDVSHFIQAFSGSHHYILDYLVEEVLNHQPENVQMFLLQTSILERLTSPLCEAVTGQAGGQAMLERLEKANLFLVPLDNERRWYRYHHLFADLLCARLQQSQPDLVAELHARAAEWCEHNGLAAEAVSHALAARDFERATRLVEQNALAMLARGEYTAVLTWIHKLPEELVHRRPRLCIYHAWVLTSTGQLDGVEPLLRSAEQHIQPDDPTNQAQDMLGNVAAIRARVAEMDGHVSRAIELARLASEHLPENSLTRCAVGFVLGDAYFIYGDLTRAGQAWSDAMRLGQAADNIHVTVVALCQLANLRKTQGQLHRAADLYQEALQLATERGDWRFRALGNIDVGLGDLLREWNDLEAARQHVMKGIKHYQHWGMPNDLAFDYTTLARVLQAQGDVAGALDTLQKAEQLIERYRVYSYTSSQVKACQVRLWLAQGNLAAAVRQVQESQPGEGGALKLIHELDYITLARVLIAQGKSDEAELADTAGRSGRGRGAQRQADRDPGAPGLGPAGPEQHRPRPHGVREKPVAWRTRGVRAHFRGRGCSTGDAFEAGH